MRPIDKIYITHWKPLKGRKQYLENRLKEFGLLKITTFMEKWDRNDENYKNQIDNYYKDNNVEDWLEHGDTKAYKLDKSSFRNLSNCEKYNFMNHIECYKDMIKNNYKLCLILEDDCILCDNFKIDLQKYIKQMNDIDWDVVFLGKYCHNQYNFPEEGHKTTNLHLTGMSNTADAYFLNYQSVRTIINNLKYPFVLPIDFEMNYWFKKYDMKVYWGKPHLIIQGSGFHKRGDYKSTVDGRD